MEPFFVRLFGTFDLRIDGKSVTNFRSDKVRSLFAYLVVSQGQTHSRDALATRFWPEQSASSANANLRNALSNLRAILKKSDLDPLTITRKQVTSTLSAQHVDVLLVDALLTEAASTTIPYVNHWEQTVALYQGDFLADLSVDTAPAFQEWRLMQQERYHQQIMSVLDKLTGHYAATRNFEKAVSSARRQLSLEPWYEPAHRRLIHALDALGQRSAALAQYERCSVILAEELGVEPDAETQALLQRILAQGSDVQGSDVQGSDVQGGDVQHKDRAGDEQKGQRTTSSRIYAGRSKLPYLANSFLGREADLATLETRLAPGAERLVTLQGIGGIGKSRLAAGLGQRMADRYRDGVYWISLETILPGQEAENRLALTTAGELGLEIEPHLSVHDQLLAHLQSREILLIFDNFEHLTDEGGLLLDILAAAPGVSMLVTSRRRLGLPGERVMPVPGLPMDDAVRLFIQRAQTAMPTFVVTTENRPHIERICRLVEGLPLGIELAAVWIEHFSCEEIADAITDNSRFLARRRKDALLRGEKKSGGQETDFTTRHDSLATVFEHSWGILAFTERQVLAQLSVFRGAFSRAAFLAVTSAPLSILSGLMTKSLVQLVAAGRYRLHEVIRTFAEEKRTLPSETVLSRDEQAATVERHHTYYLRRLHAQSNAMLLQDLENIRAAWISAIERGNRSILAESAESFGDLLRSVGLLDDGASLMRLALARVNPSDRDARSDKSVSAVRIASADKQPSDGRPIQDDLIATLLFILSGFAQQMEGTGPSLAIAEEGLLYTAEPRLRTKLYRQIARLSLETKGWDAETRRIYKSLLEDAQKIGDPLMLAGILHEQAYYQVLHFTGDYEAAFQTMGNALSLAETVANNPGRDNLDNDNLNNDNLGTDKGKAHQLVLTILRGLSMAQLRYGDYGHALVYAERLVALASQMHRRFDQIEGLSNMGHAYAFAGRYEEGIHYAEQGVQIAKENGDLEGVGLVSSNLCMMYRNAGDFERALQYGQSALEILQSLEIHRLEGQCRNRLGHTLLALAEYEEAADVYSVAIELWQPLENPNIYEAKAGLALALTHLDRPKDGLALAREVMAFVTGQDALQRVVEPINMISQCAQVFRHAGEDAQAQAAQAIAQEWIQTVASRNGDPAMRRSYLENIPARHQILISTRPHS